MHGNYIVNIILSQGGVYPKIFFIHIYPNKALSNESFRNCTILTERKNILFVTIRKLFGIKSKVAFFIIKIRRIKNFSES